MVIIPIKWREKGTAHVAASRWMPGPAHLTPAS